MQRLVRLTRFARPARSARLLLEDVVEAVRIPRSEWFFGQVEVPPLDVGQRWLPGFR
jgi:hypothetical protein